MQPLLPTYTRTVLSASLIDKQQWKHPLYATALSNNSSHTSHPALCTAGWDASQNKYLLRELLIHQELSACRHPHIVELKEVFLTPIHLAAVMEHVDGLNLQDFLTAQGGRWVLYQLYIEALGRSLGRSGNWLHV